MVLIAQAAVVPSQGGPSHEEGGKVGSAAASGPALPGASALPVELKGIGTNDALLLQNEVFYQDFRNRRQLGAWAGLVPVPWASGGVENNQGISKAGQPVVRKHPVQMAWRWLRWQPNSAIAKWFDQHCAVLDGRSRKRAIVAVARKLLVAPWRYIQHGLVPTGTVFAKEVAS